MVDGESPASLNTDLFQQLSSLTKEGKGKGERKGGGKGCYIPDNYLWVKFHLCSLLKLLVSPPSSVEQAPWQQTPCACTKGLSPHSS